MKEKLMETWAAITILWRIWFPKKRKFVPPPGMEWLAGYQWSPEEIQKMREARNGIMANVLGRHDGTK